MLCSVVYILNTARIAFTELTGCLLNVSVWLKPGLSGLNFGFMCLVYTYRVSLHVSIDGQMWSKKNAALSKFGVRKNRPKNGLYDI